MIANWLKLAGSWGDRKYAYRWVATTYDSHSHVYTALKYTHNILVSVLVCSHLCLFFTSAYINLCILTAENHKDVLHVMIFVIDFISRLGNRYIVCHLHTSLHAASLLYMLLAFVNGLVISSTYIDSNLNGLLKYYFIYGCECIDVCVRVCKKSYI